MKKLLSSMAVLAVLLAGGTSAAASAAPATPSVDYKSEGLLTPPPVPKVPGSKPAGKVANKGQVGKTRLANTNVSAKAAASTVYFRYAGGRQFLASGQSADNYAVNLILDNTINLDTARGDFHTLGEISVQSFDGKQTIEVGFTKDPVICPGGANKICLFTYWWKNGVPQCYNGCGFVDYAPEPVNAGADLSADVGQRRVQIVQSGGVWWIAYNAKWIGYYPNTLWTAATPSGPGVTFINGARFQAFYEVAASVDKTCSDIGNGLPTTNINAARVGSMTLGGKVPSTIVDSFTAFAQPGVPDGWPTTVVDAFNMTPITIRAGGPNWNFAGTAAGTTTAC